MKAQAHMDAVAMLSDNVRSTRFVTKENHIEIGLVDLEGNTADLLFYPADHEKKAPYQLDATLTKGITDFTLMTPDGSDIITADTESPLSLFDMMQYVHMLGREGKDIDWEHIRTTKWYRKQMADLGEDIS